MWSVLSGLVFTQGHYRLFRHGQAVFLVLAVLLRGCGWSASFARCLYPVFSGRGEV